MLLAMLDAVYIDAKQNKSIVAIKPKPPFRPVFRVAATRAGSGIRIINEPFDGSAVFMVETGESRTPRPVVSPAILLPELLDRLIALGEMAKQIRHAFNGNGHLLEEIEMVISNYKGLGE